MHCQDTTCITPPRWRLTDAARPGLVFFACAAHLLALLTGSQSHTLEALETQPS